MSANENSAAQAQAQEQVEMVETSAFFNRCEWALNLLSRLWKYRRAMSRRFLIAGLLAIALALRIHNRYKAELSLMPPDNSSMSMLGMLMGSFGSDGSTGGAGGMVGDLLGLKDAGQTYVKAAEGHTISDRIIQRFDLLNVYKAPDIERARRQLAHAVKVEEDKKSGLLLISVSDKDPNRATSIAKAYSEELNRLFTEVNTNAAAQERLATEARVEEAKKELEDANTALAAYASKNTTLEPDSQGRAALAIAASIEGQLIAARSDLNTLEELYTPNNERVYAARARVAALQSEYDKANSSGIINQQKTDEMPSLRKLPLIAVEYYNLERDVKVREAVFRILTQEYELARIREHHQVNTINVLESPVVPIRASFPSLEVRIALLLFAAFIFCYGTIRVEDWWNELDADEPWRNLLTPYVAVLSRCARMPILRVFLLR
jgi:capsule polysaccharide export protein KpsE/RkpR